MTKIKICGITCYEDALKAKKAGAWAIGEIFAPSSRRITIEKAAFINHKIGDGIAKVGVFVNESIDNVNTVAKECNLDFVQLHGDENKDYVKELNIPVIKAFAVNKKITPLDLKDWSVFAYLFDTYSLNKRGGTGKTFDWSLIEDIISCYRVIIAGGLTPTNIGYVVKKFKPYAVDVSSGVESIQGIKDTQRIDEFIFKVKEAQKL
ncbi:Phosphoribosylanthranilate isomerase [Candidatus Syntrophocurvum alkaliphilum]|uniref:N-(5'-phosphoribosyl)anthranilate isomerase n=1 Tax=Candidatus Syntrophocurvum alkaliphilum TaxID=2293317 RepID=A0A6I6DIM8_9FIRM|nr:phosphoribosylanthranilate isomerase [Candidatus Syntrophocurvum alkaliphilum]QGU00091.1 Phosphoribosylanthranilate isomerase [Candidatus Syntrophocurvum alkaliphilum]